MQYLLILGDTFLSFKQRGIVSVAACKKYKDIAYFMHYRDHKVKRQDFY